MCRLALLNRKGIEYIQERFGLENLLNYLERQLGGNGNGYCIIGDNCEIFRLKKGVILSNEEIAEDILNNIDNVKWVVYHTRLATAGSICDKNCHPFRFKDNTILACNGSEYGLKVKLEEQSIDKTDSEEILRLCYKDLPTKTQKYTSVCIGLWHNKVFANRNRGCLKVLTTDNGGIVFASSFPFCDEGIRIAPYSWIEGEIIPKIKQTQTNGYQYSRNIKADKHKDFWQRYYQLENPWD